VPAEDAYWSRSADALVAELSTSRDGLSSDEVRTRLRANGPNSIHDVREATVPRLLLRQFANPLVLILIFGALVSLFLREWIDASIILVVVAGSTLLGFFQEYSASQAVAALQKRLELKAHVRRDGRETIVPAIEIVPGDVLLLSAGHLVPADGVVLQAKDFLVSESALTGESFPVEKSAGTTVADSPLPQRTNCVFAGTSVRSGTAEVVVVRTGKATAFGTVAQRLAVDLPETEFARGLRNFGYLLLRIMIVLVLLVMIANALLGRPTIESLLFAVALAVGLSPELLPAIVSVTLSAGARAMAKRGVIVRRLDAIENLGSMDVLCTDKTGTLTQGVISLSDAVDGLGGSSDSVRQDAFLNAAFETGIENPLDQAIMTDGEKRGLTHDGFTKVDEIPYDFLRKRLTIVVSHSGGARHRLITKGAFANVLDLCTTIATKSGAVPLDPEHRAQLVDNIRIKGAEGFRALAVASKDADPRPQYDIKDEAELCFEGLLLFFDPPKADVKTTVEALAARGIAIKIITGDNRYVAAHVAEGVGLDPKAIITGAEFAALKAQALWAVADRTQIFAEVDPQQKEQIVHALQKAGHAVGYLGDGINDAPALHAADVGISVDQAVDVARQSADIVLLQPDLDVLCRGVEDGRKTFANTLKYITIATSSTFGNMVSMALATPFLPFLPLAAKQILLNNFLSDLPSIAISTDNVDPEQGLTPQRWVIHDVFRFMLYFGLTSSLFDGLTFAVLLAGFHAGEAAFQTAWFVISLLTELVVVLVLRTRRPALRSTPGRLLLWTAVATAIFAVACPYLPFLAGPFAFVPLRMPVLAALIAILFGYTATTEIVKLFLFRRRPHAGRS
jgi:P-type Mg2+ transporter